MVKKIVIILMFLLAKNTFACQCRFIGDLFETIEDRKNILVVGKFIKIENYVFQFKVDTILNGKLKSKIINVIGGDGASCSEMIGEYSIGKMYLLCLEDLLRYNSDNYCISSCGTSQLEIVDGKLRGRISGGVNQNQEIDLHDFFEIYSKKKPSKIYNIKNIETHDFNQLNGNGQRIGFWKIIGYDNIIIEEGEYNKNGQRAGEWKYYLIYSIYLNGNYSHAEQALKKVVQYQSDRIVIVKEYYDEKGNRLNIGDYKDGKGILYEYYDNGDIFGKYEYNFGLKNGKAEEYKYRYDNEYELNKGDFKNGFKNGTWNITKGDYEKAKEIYKNGKFVEKMWTKG